MWDPSLSLCGLLGPRRRASSHLARATPASDAVRSFYACSELLPAPVKERSLKEHRGRFARGLKPCSCPSKGWSKNWQNGLGLLSRSWNWRPGPSILLCKVRRGQACSTPLWHRRFRLGLLQDDEWEPSLYNDTLFFSGVPNAEPNWELPKKRGLKMEPN